MPPPPIRDERDHATIDPSLDVEGGHLLTPAPDPDRRPLVFQSSAPSGIEWTVERLVAGSLVAFPTDTVYALAASLSHPEALARLAALKTRPPDKPIPVLLAAATDLDLVGREPHPHLVALAGRFWPGPLTVAVPARQGMPSAVVAPDGTIGARVPNHFLAIEVIGRAGGAVAASSANRAGEPPARDAAEVLAALGPDLDVLLDGGATPGGVPSTVITTDGPDLRVVRDGPIPAEVIHAAWREILAGHLDPGP